MSSISSNYFHLKLLKSTEKLQGRSVGWRIQPFLFPLKAAVKERWGNKTAKAAEGGDEDSGAGHGKQWVERPWRNSCCRAWLNRKGAFGTEGRTSGWKAGIRKGIEWAAKEKSWRDTDILYKVRKSNVRISIFSQFWSSFPTLPGTHQTK